MTSTPCEDPDIEAMRQDFEERIERLERLMLVLSPLLRGIADRADPPGGEIYSAIGDLCDLRSSMT